MPTRPKKKCADCGDVHLCKATYAGSKRDEAKHGKPAGDEKPAKPAGDEKPVKAKSGIRELIFGKDDLDI